jgi:hypothetical protein
MGFLDIITEFLKRRSNLSDTSDTNLISLIEEQIVLVPLSILKQGGVALSIFLVMLIISVIQLQTNYPET